MFPLDRSAYAGFFARLAAALIDGFIVVLFLLPALAALLGGPRRTTTCDVALAGACGLSAKRVVAADLAGTAVYLVAVWMAAQLLV